jgi:hypothetical protein
MTPDEFDSALAELGWSGADFLRRVDLVPNTVWRWRKGTTPIPVWVEEYLKALLGIKALYEAHVAIPKPTKEDR